MMEFPDIVPATHAYTRMHIQKQTEAALTLVYAMQAQQNTLNDMYIAFSNPIPTTIKHIFPFRV